MTIAKIGSYYIRNEIFQFKARLDDEHIIDQICLEYVSNDDKYEYKMEFKQNGREISAKIHLDMINWKQQEWNIKADGIRFVYDGKISKLASCLLFYNDYYRPDAKHIVCTAINVDKSVSLHYRQAGKYEGFGFKMKERAALVTSILMGPFLKRKPIIIIYEKFSATAQDNGYYLFKYCMENKVESRYNCKIYYSIDKRAKDYLNVAEYGDHVLDFMSFRYLNRVLNAKLLVSTDSKGHAYPTQFYGGFLQAFIRRKPLVFLQHGVTAFKRVDFLYGKKSYGTCNRFIVTSDFEKKIVEENFGYCTKEIPVTGFARWDVLKDKSSDRREILVCPTWRKWLEDFDTDTFIKSTFYKTYTELLSSDKLAQVLEKHDVVLNFYLHTKFKEYLSDFKLASDQIKLIPFGSVPLNELIMSSGLLITDYSSVAWDAYYIDHPVIFYQFDVEQYLTEHGSYIDFEKELFGERVTDEGVEVLVNKIEDQIRTGFELSKAARDRKDYYFAYTDNNNCARILDVIGEFLN